jgi:folate-dependent phosphoribosylglycinamide formyltransferase PurN
MAAYQRGEVTHSGITMHFATERYDDPNAVFFRRIVPIQPDDTPVTLQARVNRLEHTWQAIITDLVVHGDISWDGTPGSIRGADLE